MREGVPVTGSIGASSPAAVVGDATIDGRERRIVAQLTKQSLVFVLDRVTGELLALLRTLSERASPGFVLAEINDLLADLTALDYPGAVDAVTHAELRELDAFPQNYVAAMVEHAAARLGVSTPATRRAVSMRSSSRRSLCAKRQRASRSRRRRRRTG